MRKALRWAITIPALGFVYLCYVYLTLPDVRVLEKTNPTTTAFMQLRMREAQEAGRKFSIRHRWVSYGQISNNLKRAVVVTEDSAFFDHEGIDITQLRASLEANWEEGRFVRGGSTITQQLAKNLYLSPSKNPIRKLKELLITRRLEAALTKRRILEIYLNVIEWGDGIFGCEAAAQTYFGKSAAALSPEEAALLAGAIINPREHSPARPTGRLKRRQQIIARRMGIKPPQPAPVQVVAPAPAEASAIPSTNSSPVGFNPINTSPPVPPSPVHPVQPLSGSGGQPPEKPNIPKVPVSKNAAGEAPLLPRQPRHK